MAVILNEKVNDGFFGLWHITEEIEDLLPLAKLSPLDLETWSAIHAVQRKKEWLATRAILNELTGESIQISYFADGRPYLKEHPMNISISHTKCYAAILLHDTATPGIDIELDSRSAERVATRILSPLELEACKDKEGYSNRKLLIHWCAKEAIYKMVPENSISYAKQIQISLNDIIEEPHPFSGTFQSEHLLVPIRLFYKSFQDLIVVWGWAEKSELTDKFPLTYNF
jgi:4'-phosphopantetheinyl transferase